MSDENINPDLTFIEKVAIGATPSDEEIANELYNICDSIHSCCHDECPIYRLTYGDIPNNKGHGCDCFKDGEIMLGFIREHAPHS